MAFPSRFLLLPLNQLRRTGWTILGFVLGCVVVQTLRVSLQPSEGDIIRAWSDVIEVATGSPGGAAQKAAGAPPAFPDFEGKVFRFDDEAKDAPLQSAIHAVFEAADKRLAKRQGRTGSDVGAPNEDLQAFLSWQSLQAQRQAAIAAYCKSHKSLPKKLEQLDAKSRMRLLKTVIVDDKHKAMYCPIGKVACTSWKTALAMLQGHYTGLQPGEHIHDLKVLIRNDLKLLSTYSRDEILSRLKTYPSFLFVRHPFERLVSAYRNKFLTKSRDDYQKRYGVAIIRQYRPNASEAETAGGWNVTFPEFVRWLVDHNVSDIHWDLYDNICRLCTLRYDYIGRMDTFERDSHYILQSVFGANSTDFFPHSNPSKENSEQVLLRYFKDVPSDDIERLRAKYDSDFQMFGFTWPPS